MDNFEQFHIPIFISNSSATNAFLETFFQWIIDVSSQNCVYWSSNQTLTWNYDIRPGSFQQICKNLDMNTRRHVSPRRHDIAVKHVKSDRTKAICYYHLQIIKTLYFLLWDILFALFTFLQNTLTRLDILSTTFRETMDSFNGHCCFLWKFFSASNECTKWKPIDLSISYSKQWHIARRNMFLLLLWGSK